MKSQSQWPQHRSADFDRAHTMERLERLVDIRSKVVARGKALIANPEYPDKEILRKVSHLLAHHIRH